MVNEEVGIPTQLGLLSNGSQAVEEFCGSSTVCCSQANSSCNALAFCGSLAKLLGEPAADLRRELPSFLFLVLLLATQQLLPEKQWPLVDPPHFTLKVF